MRHRVFLSFLLVSIVCTVAGPLISQSLDGITRLTVNQLGTEANDNSSQAVLGPNGKFVALQSSASNLVPGDSNNAPDIFLRNLETGAFTRVSMSPSGADANDGSFAPFISATTPNGFGALVFASDASNLVRPASMVPDTNGVRDIFFALPGRGRLGRVTLGMGPSPADGASNDPSVAVAADPNRIFVAYSSAAANLVTGDSNGERDVFLTTIVNSEGEDEPLINGYTTILVSKPAEGAVVTDGPSTKPQISGDGRFIVFESAATNLVSGFSSSERQIYLYEVASGEVTPITRGFDGAPGNGSSRNPSISYSGSFIVFLSRATNLIDDGIVPSGDALQIVRFNTRSKVFDRVNVSATGEAGNGQSGSLMDSQITPDGRLVVFTDTASNLVQNDTNGVSDVFVKDMEGGSVTRVSVSASSVEGNGASVLPFLSRAAFSSRSASILFASNASNLVAGDQAEQRDVFLSQYTAPRPTLKSNTRIEAPPDVVITDDDVKVTTPLYTFPTVVPRRLAAAKTRSKIRYQVEAFREGMTGRAADRRRVISRRNQITIKNLKPGVYATRFRVLTLRNDTVVRRTPFSPAQRVSEEPQA
jgi:Tol biopolymer transport system component